MRALIMERSRAACAIHREKFCIVCVRSPFCLPWRLTCALSVLYDFIKEKISMAEKRDWRNDYSRTAEWKKENTRFYGIRFTKNVDQEIIDFIDSQPNKNEFFRQLVKDEMKHQKRKSKKAE